MRRKLPETIDTKGKIALQRVRYRTEISMGFLQPKAKFFQGLGRDSGSAA
jgi:hypothetical protein